MKLPSLKFSIPFIFLCWCVAAVMTHGTVMLAYPAMWAVVGVFFYVLHLLIRSPAPAQAVEPAVPQGTERMQAAEDSSTDQQVSASA